MTWSACCGGTGTCTATPPPTGLAISPRPDQVGSSSSSSGTRCFRTRSRSGLSWTLLGMTMEEVIQEYLALPLKDSVKEKWLYGNAARILKLG